MIDKLEKNNEILGHRLNSKKLEALTTSGALMVTTIDDVKNAVQYLKEGACDNITKPFCLK